MMRALMIACVLACAPLLAFAQTPAATPPAAATPTQEVCGVFVRGSDSAASYVAIPGFSVITAEPPLSVRTGQLIIQAVVCDRHSIFISPRDFRVLTDLHVPLYIRNGDRLAALELSGGQFRVRFPQGAPTDAERAALAPALDATQTAYAAMQAHP